MKYEIHWTIYHNEHQWTKHDQKWRQVKHRKMSRVKLRSFWAKWFIQYLVRCPSRCCLLLYGGKVGLENRAFWPFSSPVHPGSRVSAGEEWPSYTLYIHYTSLYIINVGSMPYYTLLHHILWVDHPDPGKGAFVTLIGITAAITVSTPLRPAIETRSRQNMTVNTSCCNWKKFLGHLQVTYTSQKDSVCIRIPYHVNSAGMTRTPPQHPVQHEFPRRSGLFASRIGREHCQDCQEMTWTEPQHVHSKSTWSGRNCISFGQHDRVDTNATTQHP